MSAIHGSLCLHTTYSNVGFSHNARLRRRTGVRRLGTATRASALARDLSPEGALSKRSAPKPTDRTANERGAKNGKSALLCRFSCSQAAAILGDAVPACAAQLLPLDRRREPRSKVEGIWCGSLIVAGFLATIRANQIRVTKSSGDSSEDAVGRFKGASRTKIEPSLSGVPAGDKVVGTPPS